MSNLLVTIIGIALGAAAVVAGMVFLGPIYQNYKAQVLANTMINQAQQLSSAGTMYVINNGYTKFSEPFMISGASTDIEIASTSTMYNLRRDSANPTFLIPSYLKEMPLPGGIGTKVTNTYLTPSIYHSGSAGHWDHGSIGSCNDDAATNFVYWNGTAVFTHPSIGPQKTNLKYFYCTNQGKNYVVFTATKNQGATCPTVQTKEMVFPENNQVVKACQKLNQGKNLSSYTIDTARTQLPIISLPAPAQFDGASAYFCSGDSDYLGVVQLPAPTPGICFIDDTFRQLVYYSSG